MKPVSLRSIAAGAGLFALGVATTLVAQTAADSAQRVELKRADLSGAPGMEVIVSLSEYKKGEGIDLHIHHVARLNAVVNMQINALTFLVFAQRDDHLHARRARQISPF